MSASRRSEKLGRQQRAGVPVRAPANNLYTRSRSPDSYLLSYSFSGGMSRRDGGGAGVLLKGRAGLLSGAVAAGSPARYALVHGRSVRAEARRGSESEIWHMHAWIWWHRGGIASSSGVCSYCRDVPLRTAGLLGTVTHGGGCQPASQSRCLRPCSFASDYTWNR